MSNTQNLIDRAREFLRHKDWCSYSSTGEFHWNSKCNCGLIPLMEDLADLSTYVTSSIQPISQ